MAKKIAKRSASAGKTPGSADLKAVLKRVKGSDLSNRDKRIVADILAQTVKLKQLVERSTQSRAGKKVLARLPFGFDIVK